MIIKKIDKPGRALVLLLAFAALICGMAVEMSARHMAVAMSAQHTAASEHTALDTDYTNPVINGPFPDPSVLNVGSLYYAYSTNSGPNLPCERSADLVHWTPLPDAMPTLPSWVEPGRTWAPEVRALPAGRGYVVFFCAHCRATNDQAVGVATGPTPDGPFTSNATAPLIDQTSMGGSIDPSCFLDPSGQRYLVWKNDGNSRGQDTWLWVQRLSSDGTQLAGQPTRLIKQDQPWEGNLVEAPTLWKHGSKYYLFYSANNYSNCSYAIGYAVAPAITGPFVKPRTVPFVSSTGDVCGPGGEDIVQSPDGTTWMAYHYWGNGPGSFRCMSIDPLIWDRDVPYLLGPSRWPQPAPR